MFWNNNSGQVFKNKDRKTFNYEIYPVVVVITVPQAILGLIYRLNIRLFDMFRRACQTIDKQGFLIPNLFQNQISLFINAIWSYHQKLARTMLHYLHCTSIGRCIY